VRMPTAKGIPMSPQVCQSPALCCVLVSVSTWET
jgi:hypothetical protein